MEYDSNYCILLASHSVRGFSFYLFAGEEQQSLCIWQRLVELKPGRKLLSDEEKLYGLLYRSLYFYCMFIIVVSKANNELIKNEVIIIFFQTINHLFQYHLLSDLSIHFSNNEVIIFPNN